ncbi:hypothetical protein CLU79DRAFT_770392 [Phycomyces nitens]|nr:hypothetical protein CLU79DRAFT_770392 [Phycomyces nitens]
MAPRSTYPITGVFYFLGHPQLWSKMFCPFLLTLAFGIVSIVLAFVYLLPLQAHALINVNCPSWLAWICSVIFVLLESAIMDLLFFAIVMPFFQDALFDATLMARGMSRMFATRVPVDGFLLCCRGISSGLALVWFLLISQVVIMVITAPLHLIPVIGTIIACYINGWVISWGHRIHYDLEFRGFTVSESRRYAWANKNDYCHFGAVAGALELIPVFNLVFMWTNVCSMALWVADEYEKNEAAIGRDEQRFAQEQGIGYPSGGPSYYPQVNSYPSQEGFEQSRLVDEYPGSSGKKGYHQPA